MRALRSLMPPPALLCVALAWFTSENMPEPGKDMQAHASPNPPPKLLEERPEHEDIASSVVPKARDYTNDIAKLASRPLFSPTRRNPEPEAVENPEHETTKAVVAEPTPAPAPVVAIAPERPKVEYRGMIRSDGTRSALLHDMSNSSEYWVVVSDEVSYWVVAEITTSYVRFTHDVHEFIVEIRQ